MKRNLIWFALALAALCGQLALWPARAESPQPFALVKDINTAPQPRGSLRYGSLFGAVGNALLFNATTPQAGNELWRTDGTDAGTQLVKDILPGENGAFDYQNGQALVLNGRLLFAPNDGAHGTELWASDGTPAGTQLVKDLFPGADDSNPLGLVASGNRAFFTAQVSATQRALWSTDGTPEGTVMLHAFAAIESAQVVAGGTLFFSAAATGVDYELWASDGTPEGTQLVKDITPGPAGSFPNDLFAYSASEVWFSARGSANGPYELWTSDGTPGGTHLFRQIELGPITNPSQFVVLHRAAQASDVTKILFNASDGTHGQELWTSDGTPEGTAQIGDVNPNGDAEPAFRGFTPSRGALGPARAFYQMDDGTTGDELWLTDGKVGDARLLTDINAGPDGNRPSKVITVGTISFFAATSATAGRELWKSDGSAQGTVQVADINAGAADSDPKDLTAFNGALYFMADDGVHGRELWTSDGATATLVRDIQPGGRPGAQRILGVELGALFLSADDGATGIELWKSDGTQQGTVLVKNIAPDDGGIYLYQGYNAAARGDKLMFGVDPQSNGENLAANTSKQSPLLVERDSATLWQSDGTAVGTALVKSFPNATPGASPRELTALGEGMLFASSDSADVVELWRSDGTTAGTAILTNTVRPNIGIVYNLIRLNDLVVFDVYTTTVASPRPQYTSLWRTDGTPAGTQVLTTNVNIGSGQHAVSGNTLFFAGSPKGTNNVELWASDGTAAGTRQVTELFPGDTGSYPQAITPGRPGEVFFLTRSEFSEYELWKSDGTAAGTKPVHDMGTSDRFAFNTFVYAGGKLFFSASDGVHGMELWASDGTSAGTDMVANLYPGPGSSDPQNLVGLNDVLYFSATGVDGRRTLWTSDGTSVGTHPVRSDTGAPLNPEDLTVAQGQLLFSAADEAHGREVWASDGTPQGTHIQQDLVPGPSSSNPRGIIAAGKQVYFTADTPGVGRELWALASSAPGQPTPTSTPSQTPAKRVYLPLLWR